MSEPVVPRSFADFPADPQQRVEACAALFRHHLSVVQGRVTREIREAIEAGRLPAGLSGLPPGAAPVYERIVQLSDTDKQTALALAEYTARSVVAGVLYLLANAPDALGGGAGNHLGDDHWAWYKLVLELTSADRPAERLEINRDRGVFLGDPGLKAMLDAR